jgi:hypothetical protein
MRFISTSVLIALVGATPARGGDVYEDDCSVSYPHCEAIDSTEIASVETIVGRVVAIEEQPLCDGQPPFVTLTLRLDRPLEPATRDVYTAPRSFLAAAGLAIEVGDDVAVVGVSSWSTVAGELTAIRVDVGGRQLYLRGPDGRPRWLLRGPSS